VQKEQLGKASKVQMVKDGRRLAAIQIPPSTAIPSAQTSTGAVVAVALAELVVATVAALVLRLQSPEPLLLTLPVAVGIRDVLLRM
jgi:hypothetical protein